jgi:fucokinase
MPQPASPTDCSHPLALGVAMEANAAAYRRALQTSAPGDCWDFVVLTAASEKQAQGYRQELALRHRAVGSAGAFFPAIQRSIVVPDPADRRAGSGGATLAVVQALCREQGVSPKDFDRLRILLIHSGGASQRLPAYSPLGKIFAPLPLLRPDGQIATLFDHLYLTLAGLPERLGPGMLILAGDVVLLFDHRDVTPPPAGVTAISMRVKPEVALGHGVFVIGGRGEIRQTLQKVSADTMRQAGATDARDRVLIDTGLLFFDPAATRSVASLAGVGARMAGANPATGLHGQSPEQIDLYEDMTAALATATDRKIYLHGPSFRKMLWKALHGIPFQAMDIAGEFLHLGTTRQFRDAMVGLNPSPAAELFQKDVLVHNEWETPPGRRVYHSVLRADGNVGGSLGAESVVEHSILCAGSRIGAGSVVSQVVALNWPIDLPDQRLLFQAPVRGTDGNIAFVQVVCGVEDDFKGQFAAGKCIYLNRPIDQWLSRHRIRPDELWQGIPSEQRTLWTARLFIATRERDAAPAALRLGGDKPASPAQLKAWRKAQRYSMAMILRQADPGALIEQREMISAHLHTAEWIAAIQRRQDRPIDSVVGRYATAGAYRESERLLAEMAGGTARDPLAAIDQARSLWSVAQLLQRPDHPEAHAARLRIEPFLARAFAKVAQASEMGHRNGDSFPEHANRSIIAPASGPSRLPHLTPGVDITATSPVRLDLAGGWSDTPPFCFERGGHVINVAIDLDGRPPVRAIVRTLHEKKLVLESHDLGRKIELTRLDPARDTHLHDPFALQKIAMRLAGLLPRDANLARHFQALGAGLHVITQSRVPKGSGLGTSSILAATLLAALHSLRGPTPGATTLIEQTLLLEQRLSTGGGWQDQVGGIVGGVKSTLTAPGIPQKPQVEELALSDDQLGALQDRLVVYYSGQQRLARDILRRVMGRWLAREPAVLLLTEQLTRGAASLRAALLKGRWSAASEQIARYWQIKKELYPGSTTPAIDLLLLEMRDEYQAAGLAGAGGGGFAYFLCKEARQADRLRQRLAAHAARPGNLGGVYETLINRKGLQITQSRG